MASRQPRSAIQRRSTSRVAVARRRASGQPRRAWRTSVRPTAWQLQQLQQLEQLEPGILTDQRFL